MLAAPTAVSECPPPLPDEETWAGSVVGTGVGSTGAAETATSPNSQNPSGDRAAKVVMPSSVAQR